MAEVLMLGNRYPLTDDASKAAFEKAFRRLIWVSYRKGMAPIGTSKLTTDAGWGCMVRSGQMMVSRALQLFYLMEGRDRAEAEKEDGEEELDLPPGIRNTLLWLVTDAPSRTNVYSMHNIAEVGSVYGKKPGEWYGPNAVAHVLRDLTLRYNQEMDGPMRMAVFNDGVLYRDRVHDLCRAESEAPDSTTWKTACVVMVAMRLGLGKLNPEFIPSIVSLFELPQCLGYVGGTPRHSLYFVGARGTDLLFLDPHRTQPSPSTPTETASPDALPASHVATFTPQAPAYMPAHVIDPSLAVAFMCRSGDEFDTTCNRIRELFAASDGDPLFEVADVTPAYVREGSDIGSQSSPFVDSDGGAAGESGAGAGAGAGTGAETPSTTGLGDDSDDDEYVLL